MSLIMQEKIVDMIAGQIERINDDLLKKDDFLDKKVQSLFKLHLAYLREFRVAVREVQLAKQVFSDEDSRELMKELNAMFTQIPPTGLDETAPQPAAQKPPLPSA